MKKILRGLSGALALICAANTANAVKTISEEKGSAGTSTEIRKEKVSSKGSRRALRARGRKPHRRSARNIMVGGHSRKNARLARLARHRRAKEEARQLRDEARKLDRVAVSTKVEEKKPEPSVVPAKKGETITLKGVDQAPVVTTTHGARAPVQKKDETEQTLGFEEVAKDQAQPEMEHALHEEGPEDLGHEQEDMEQAAVEEQEEQEEEETGVIAKVKGFFARNYQSIGAAAGVVGGAFVADYFLNDKKAAGHLRNAFSSAWDAVVSRVAAVKGMAADAAADKVSAVKPTDAKDLEAK